MKEPKAYKTKNGIKFLSKPEFFVNSEKEVVTCTVKVLFPGQHEPKIFVGRAKRSGSDVFNESIGKKLSRSRAKKSVYKAAAKEYKNLIDQKKAEIELLSKQAERIDYLVGMESGFQEMVIKDPHE